MITVKMLLHAHQCSRTRSPIFSVGQVVTYYWPLPFVCLVTLGLRVLCIKLKFVIKLTPTLWIESPFSFFHTAHIYPNRSKSISSSSSSSAGAAAAAAGAPPASPPAAGAAPPPPPPPPKEQRASKSFPLHSRANKVGQ